MSGPVHTHRWVDGELLLNGCMLCADAARAAAPPVEPTPEWQWTDPEQTNAGPRSPDPVAGLREAASALLRAADAIDGDGFDYSFQVELSSARESVRAALLASDKPGLDEELLTDAMYEAGRKGLIYDGITNKDHAAVIAAEYERLSGGGS